MAEPPRRSEFPVTRWTLVIEAQRSDQPGSEAALANLCNTYWYPIYAYARRSGKSHQDAEDLTQSLFARLFNPEAFAKLGVDQRAGKLRSYLLTAMKNQIAGDWRKDQALKRGGGQTPISLDADQADARFKAEPSTDATPESEFERQWAVTQLDTAFQRLRQESEAKGKLSAFEALREVFANPGLKANFAEIGERIGLTEGNARVTAHRMRARLRDLLLEVIAETVDTDEEAEAEIAHLRAVLAR